MAYRPFFCEMREERLWSDGPVLETHDGVFPLGTDSVLLADFCNAPKNGRICDLGSGTGFLLVRLLWENPGLRGTAAEIEPAAAENSRVNLLRNGLSPRGAVFAGDLRMLPGTEEYDLAVSNPPYFPKGSPGGSAARKETCLTFGELCLAAKGLLKPGGRLCVVHRPERAEALCGIMCANGLAPTRIRFVRERAEKAPNLVLLEGTKGGKECVTEPELILRGADGSYTQETRRIYRMEERA